MKSLLLFIIALALTPTAYPSEEIDRDKYHYHCKGGGLGELYACAPNLKEGEMLSLLLPFQATLYCNKDELIIAAKETKYGVPRYNCIYNGRPIKEYREYPSSK